jgi:antitoxin CcdA
MKLDAYLARSGMTLHGFGKRVGVSHSTVQRWASGQSAPRGRATMQAVVSATGGAVTAEDFFGPAADGKQRGFAEVQTPLVTEARSLGLDPGAIAAKALEDAISAEKERRWVEENRAAMDAWNAWTDANELPLAKYRAF